MTIQARDTSLPATSTIDPWKQFDKHPLLKPLGSIWPEVHPPVGEKRTVGLVSCHHSVGRRAGTRRIGGLAM